MVVDNYFTQVEVVWGDIHWTPFTTELAQRIMAVSDGMSAEEARIVAQDFTKICWPCDCNLDDERFRAVVSALGFDLLGQNRYLATVERVLGNRFTLVNSDDYDAYITPSNLIRSAVIRGISVANAYLTHSVLGEEAIRRITCRIFDSMQSGFGAEECVDYEFRQEIVTNDYYSVEQKRAHQMCVYTFWNAVDRDVTLDESLFDSEYDGLYYA